MLFLVLGVFITLSQHLNTPSRENSWVLTQTPSSTIPFWTCQHHKMRLLSHLNAMTTLLAALMGSGDWHWLRWWIRKKKTSHASFSIQVGHQANFTGLVVMIEGTYPQTGLSWRFRLLLHQQIEEHISSWKRKGTKPRTTLREREIL